MVFVYGAHAVFGMYRNLEVIDRIMQIMDILDLDLWVLAAIVFPTNNQ